MTIYKLTLNFRNGDKHVELFPSMDRCTFFMQLASEDITDIDSYHVETIN